MANFLIYKYDRNEDQKVRKLAFSTEPEAVIMACTVLDEEEIRDRCKGTRMP
jgi:hypothetical protein